jgi:hypothetical protein
MATVHLARDLKHDRAVAMKESLARFDKYRGRVRP